MSFDGVVGQERAVEALRAQLARTGGSGATLLAGPEGTGRFLLAHRAARAILGEAARVDSLRHPDLTVLDPEAGIDGVREVARALVRRPAEGPRQVLVVRDADRLSLEAHNALLKTLEEPPADAAIFLVAEDVSRLPETVVSRCRLVRVRPLTGAETERVLAGLGVPAAAAVDAEGSPGRAVYHHQHGVGEAADRLLRCLLERRPEGPAEAERITRKRKEEDTHAARRRCTEVLRVVAARLRRELPEREPLLRLVTESLGSLVAHVNASMLFVELALAPWKKTTP